jgi:hypothetical protein
MTNSGRFWRALALLARWDIAAGVIITLALLVAVAGR